MKPETRLISYEESLLLPENRLEEIVNGEIRTMPPATQEHNDLIEHLAEILRAQLNRQKYVVLTAGYGLGIRKTPLFTYRGPDLMVFAAAALKTARSQKHKPDPYIWATPELVVECLSPSNRKGAVRELISDYSSIAVPELWLIYPEQRRFSSYRFEGQQLRESHTAQAGSVSPWRLANVTVDLEALWEAFDKGLFA